MMGAGAERSLAELAQEIASAAVRLAAATALWLRSIGEFDAREGWAGCGIRSCAHWLAWQCGLSPGTAREHVRVARALRDLPVIAAAFDSGRLSYAEVRALTRVAEPATEAELLAFAVEATASQPERTVRQWRRAGAAGETPPAAPRERFDYWWDGDGSLVAHLRLGPERGAAFLDAVNSLAERAARRERAAAKRQDTDREGSGSADPPERPTAAPVCDADEDDEVAAGRERSTARRCAALAALADAAADADRRAGDPP